MLFSRLSWRVGAPIVLLVLAETAAVVAYMSWQIASEDRLRLIDTADRMASFLGNVRTETPSALAPSLSRLSGLEVFVFGKTSPNDDEIDPAFKQRLLAVPVDGEVHAVGDSLVVAVAMRTKDVLLVRRPAWQSWTDPRVLQVLAAFWLLALLTTWIVLRRLGHPLRQLASQLPHIDDERSIELDALGRPDEIGDVARAFVRTRDALLSERESRQRIEKLAVLGRMTAALAHEVQNPVAAIRMHAQLLRGGGHDEEAVTIEQEAIRIEELLNQWLFLTRPEPPALGDLDLAAQLHTLVTAQRPRAEHAAVRIDLQVPPALPVRGDGKRLQHVFRNLIDNAIQAMPSGGVLTIAANARADGRVQLTFADRGRGFSPKALQHFTEFFFSEKEGGMGIGLSVAAEILKAHGGSLSAANRPDGGAVVTVLLPTTPPAA